MYVQSFIVTDKGALAKATQDSPDKSVLRQFAESVFGYGY